MLKCKDCGCEKIFENVVDVCCNCKSSNVDWYENGEFASDHINTPEEDEMLPVIQSQWKTLCAGLPKSVKLYLSEYGNAVAYENNTLTIDIKGTFAKKMINTEKNIITIAEKFSHFLSTKINISILEKEETKIENLSVSDVEGLLQF